MVFIIIFFIIANNERGVSELDQLKIQDLNQEKAEIDYNEEGQVSLQ